MSDTQMTDDASNTIPGGSKGNLEETAVYPAAHELDHIAKLKCSFEARLVSADLRAEALRAGMIDLDGLRLIDTSGLCLDETDRVIGGRKLMEDLRRNKPWLFAAASSSSVAAVPSSRPMRQKMAMEMTDEEYAAARNAITEYRL